MLVHRLKQKLNNGGITVKRYLTAIFIGLSAIIIIIGIGLDLYWSGIAAWGIAIILLIFAIRFTKYIPNEKRKKQE